MVKVVGSYPSQVTWLICACAAFSLGAVIDDPVMSVAVTTAGLVASAVAVFGRRGSYSINPTVIAGILALLVVIGANTQRMGRFSLQPGSHQIYLVLAMATAVGLAVSSVWAIRPLVILAALITVTYASLIILIPNWMPDLSSDVYQAHAAAGRAMQLGENPYSDAVLFESGDPNKPDDTVVAGYPYPLPPLITYGSASLLTDSRVVSLAAWMAFVGMLAWYARRTGRIGDVALAALVLVATTPIWRMALFMGWTEPVSIVLLIGGVLSIQREKRWGWIMLGVGLASKQYLVFLAPLVLIYRDKRGERPGWLALLAAALVAGFPAIFGVEDYYRSIVANALEIGFRPDTQSINGLIAAVGGTAQIPTIVALIAVSAVLLLMWRTHVHSELLVASGVLVLGVAFLTTSAFPNYWMLLVGLAAGSAVVAAADDEDGRAHPTQSHAAQMDE